NMFYYHLFHLCKVVFGGKSIINQGLPSILSLCSYHTPTQLYLLTLRLILNFRLKLTNGINTNIVYKETISWRSQLLTRNKFNLNSRSFGILRRLMQQKIILCVFPHFGLNKGRRFVIKTYIIHLFSRPIFKLPPCKPYP